MPTVAEEINNLDLNDRQSIMHLANSIDELKVALTTGLRDIARALEKRVAPIEVEQKGQRKLVTNIAGIIVVSFVTGLITLMLSGGIG